MLENQNKIHTNPLKIEILLHVLSKMLWMCFNGIEFVSFGIIITFDTLSDQCFFDRNQTIYETNQSLFLVRILCCFVQVRRFNKNLIRNSNGLLYCSKCRIYDKPKVLA